MGVSGDSKSVSLGEETKANVYTYLPRTASEDVLSLLGMTILVRTAGDPAALTRPVRDEILKLDPTLAVFNVDTMSRMFRARFWFRACAPRCSNLGLLGLTLAGVGLFGVVGYSVPAARGKSASAWRWARGRRRWSGWCWGKRWA